MRGILMNKIHENLAICESAEGGRRREGLYYSPAPPWGFLTRIYASERSCSAGRPRLATFLPLLSVYIFIISSR